MLDAYLSCVDAVISAAIISFFAMVLMDCLNTIYVCYISDRDLQTVSNQTVYAILNKLLPVPQQTQPQNLISVQQSGDVAYQPPSQQQQQQSSPIPTSSQIVGGMQASSSVSQRWLQDSLAAAAATAPEPAGNNNTENV